MKQVQVLTISLLLFTLAGCGEKVTLGDLKKFTATESYPEDIFLDTTTNKRALIIVAHDDDDCAMSGTVAKLTSAGWSIKQLSLVVHTDASGKNPATIICEGNEPLLPDGYYRIGLDTMKAPYMPISYEQISQQFLTDKVADVILQKTNDIKPAVIFTLDDIKGAYGHPEHIFISSLVKRLFENGQLEADKIYQSVYTDHMEEEIMVKWLRKKMKTNQTVSDIANEMYGISGMPEPTTQVNISQVAETKMNYLKSYNEDVRKNLRKFIPYFEEFDGASYFTIFDKEYFRVIEKPALQPI